MEDVYGVKVSYRYRIDPTTRPVLAPGRLVP